MVNRKMAVSGDTVLVGFSLSLPPPSFGRGVMREMNLAEKNAFSVPLHCFSSLEVNQIVGHNSECDALLIL
jgi:hypothetical protein